ncbi:MAG: peptidase C11 [Lachnospiraceae bacterium]|nr:peptidase C11 [Lachnospiraceae bacterium]
MADQGRKKNISGAGNGVHRRGSGLGTGPVGSGSAFSGGGSSGGERGPSRGPGGLIVIILMVLLGGGGGIGALLGGGGNGGGTDALSSVAGIAGSVLGAGFGNSTYANVSGASSDWVTPNNSGSLDASVASEARSRYTTVKGNGEDEITMMVYMCGTDLESKHGMASNDLNEMMKAEISDKIKIIVYTGGCRQWQNGISSQTNQIYRVRSGRMELLEADMGNKAMTDPATLTEFINYCSKNYPSNRNMLVFWDHGGGSLSGYGYDELHSSSGSMTLGGINKALGNAGIKYDIIGFDACLMATVETDLMAASYADYMIASEETEPGVGWYYTRWLTELSKNTSMASTEIGKMIIDDFVDVCDRSCRGQKTTLSIVDLAELSETLPDDFKAFSKKTTDLITEKKYSVVADARSASREFAQSSQIDQVDLVNFATNMGTEEGKKLADTVLAAVKYNRTSSNMTNAYGVSIYFPYRKTSKVNTAQNIYGEIGLDSEYSDCIREFAGIQSTGQSVGASYGTTPFDLIGGQSSGYGLQSLETILNMMNAFSGVSGRSLSAQDSAQYVCDNQFDAGQLNWKTDEDGNACISLPAEQWKLVDIVEYNMFVDDGTGYVDMGLDVLYSIDDKGNLIPDNSGTWMSINDQPVAYYHTDTTGNTIWGYVPAMLNDERVKLMIVTDNTTGESFVAGADPDYESVTDTVSRGLIEIKDGDKLDFLCDYYSYNGDYLDSYYLGDEMNVSGELKVTDTYVGSKFIGFYKFTDIYGAEYFSDRMPQN